MTPPSSASMRLAAACATQKAPERLVAITWSHWPASMSTAGFLMLTPALSTSTSERADLLERALHLLAVADVAGDHVRAGPPGEDDHLAALVAEALRRRGADPAGAAGDDDLLAGKTPHGSLLSRAPLPVSYPCGRAAEAIHRRGQRHAQLLRRRARRAARRRGAHRARRRRRYHRHPCAPACARAGHGGHGQHGHPVLGGRPAVGGRDRGAGPAHPRVPHRQEPHGAARPGGRGLRPRRQRPQPQDRGGVARDRRCSSTPARPARPGSACRARSPSSRWGQTAGRSRRS